MTPAITVIARILTLKMSSRVISEFELVAETVVLSSVVTILFFSGFVGVADRKCATMKERMLLIVVVMLCLSAGAGTLVYAIGKTISSMNSTGSTSSVDIASCTIISVCQCTPTIPSKY